MLNFERRNSGRDVDSKVGRVEYRIVTGAIDHGSVHDDRDFRLDKTDRGGCVEGVSMSFVRATSRGANNIPAMLAAETATTSEAIGDGDDRMSRPPGEPAEGLI